MNLILLLSFTLTFLEAKREYFKSGRDEDVTFIGQKLKILSFFGEDITSKEHLSRFREDAKSYHQISHTLNFSQQNNIYLENFLSDSWNDQRKDNGFHLWNGEWISDTEFLFRDNDGSLVIKDALRRNSRVIATGNKLRSIGFSADVKKTKKFWSADEKYLMYSEHKPYSIGVDKGWKSLKYSYLYTVYNKITGRMTRLQPDYDLLFSLGLDVPIIQISEYLLIEDAQWGPVGSNIAYVYGGNIFYRETPESKDIPITTSGKLEDVFNGKGYANQMKDIKKEKSFWFSPNGDRLAWLEMDSRGVQQSHITYYNSPSEYPIEYTFRYPKPGHHIQEERVYFATVRGVKKTPRSIMLDPPAELPQASDRFVFYVSWVNNDNEIAVTWTNRHQNKIVIRICNVYERLPKCQDSLIVQSSRGWIELLDNKPKFTKDGQYFAIILSVNGYAHVNVVDRVRNETVPLTSGPFVVSSIQKWNEESNLIYFEASPIEKPLEKYIYTVTDLKSEKPGIVTKIEANPKDLRSRERNCKYNDYKFSKNASFYFMACNGPSFPQVYLYQTNPNIQLDVLVPNIRMSQKLLQTENPKIVYLDVPVAKGKYMAKVKLYLPPNFSENKKYPLMIEVYGGPNFPQVTKDNYLGSFGRHLTTEQNFIYGKIDGRGSTNKMGDDMLFEIYKKLGQVEIEDQIDVTTQLIHTYKFIDQSKIAIWGLSYGGFATAHVLARDAEGDNIFKCGISVSPATNCAHYDSYYTIKYMGLPYESDNLEGYQATDVCRKASNFKNKTFLLMHGTADDNVLFQHSMMLAKALQDAGVKFRQVSMPDEAHHRNDYGTQYMKDFVANECFKG